ncbi:hypothetical protein [Enterococcus casseliflavus]|uniref:hypothetical protein n=1 Tax=Enterococcus casseliflavus TaxID=37734 RepID=UPI00032F4C4E|nr:hypothetical protein [Enterococcus casseliflavus]EOH85446.1 hypothetical protein UAM_00054 [Enterococcus casseliflavus ATCC 49996]EOU10130.1 hypothetical protein I582_00641 [Enterococcus casseliflavus ATCC 49996]MCD5192380.1 hypothetical protein [Enterococcus casseliflavus]QQB84055.1 hypothetical protein I6H55_08880 [Enterococcus casseliflavus]
MSEILRVSDKVQRNESQLSLHDIHGELVLIAQNNQDKETVAIYLNDFQIFTLLQHLTKFLVKDKKTD